MTREELLTRKIGVLYGGLSAEREVSLRTGAAILRALNDRGYNAVGIDVTRDVATQLRETGIEVAFLALHGRYGEDGTIQGLLEILAIPYTGSGVLSSALAMDKGATKAMLIREGILTPRSIMLEDGGGVEELRSAGLSAPLIAKPPLEGSTIGIAVARTDTEVTGALETARRHDDRVLVEEFIQGREMTAAVLDGEALPLIEIVPKSGFYDYASKYTPGSTAYLVPAPVEDSLREKMQQAAVQACRALGCSGAARVDFLVRGEECFCLEVNTIPGMTETSLLPKSAAEAGLGFADLVERILASAGLNKR